MRLQENDTIFHNWKIKKIIGEGSFGTVYEIEKNEFGRTYRAAAKVISVPKNQSDYMDILDEGMTAENITEYYRSLVDDIIGECDLMERMKGDSHIVSYEDHHVEMMEDGTNWTIYIRMELLKPLGVYTKENSLTQKDVIQLGIDICRGLETCQKFNVIHRDIKPENIFVSDANNYKLGDFGISKVMGRSEMAVSKKGTQVYMAPEVYRGEQYDKTVDIYSLGIVLFRLMNDNRTPFLPPYPTPIRYKDKEAALQKRLMGETIPKPCNASPEFAKVIQKACSFKAQDRYQKPHEMRRALEFLLEEKEEDNKNIPLDDEASDKEDGTIGPSGGGRSIQLREEEARRKAREEQRKRLEEEARQKVIEEEKKRLEEETRRKAEEYEAWRRVVVEKTEEEERRRLEEEERRRAEEEERRRLEEEERRRAEEEERKRLEEEERRRAEEEERKRLEEEKFKKEAEEKERIIAEARQKAIEAKERLAQENQETATVEDRTMLSHNSEAKTSTVATSQIKLRQEDNAAVKVKPSQEGLGIENDFDDFKDLEPIMTGVLKAEDNRHNVSDVQKEHIYGGIKKESPDKKKVMVIICLLLIVAGIFCITQSKRVPDVTGMTLEEAKTAFEQAGMQLGDTEYKFSDQVPQGNIMSQKKKGGHLAWKNSRQAVVVSDGTERVEMPDLTNKTLKEAAAVLDDMHLGLMVAVRPTYSLTVELENVCGQEPAAGETVQKGADVVLCISQGGLAMPDLRGKSREEAETLLAQQGITVVCEEEFNKDVAAGQVSSQSVEPGTMIDAATPITLKISKGVETFGVPNVVGLSQEEAIQTLISAGYKEKKITVSQEYSDSVAAGVVISQSIAKDTQVEKGGSITITVSLGKKPQDSGKAASGSGGANKSNDGWIWEEMD